MSPLLVTEGTALTADCLFVCLADLFTKLQVGLELIGTKRLLIREQMSKFWKVRVSGALRLIVIS